MHALALSGTNFFFSKFADHGEKERKRHNLKLMNHDISDVGLPNTFRRPKNSC